MLNNNYNTNSENVQLNLKIKLKEVLKMTRAPRDITPFWAFYFLWTQVKQYANFQQLNEEQKIEYLDKSNKKWSINNNYKDITHYYDWSLTQKDINKDIHYYDWSLTQKDINKHIHYYDSNLRNNETQINKHIHYYDMILRNCDTDNNNNKDIHYYDMILRNLCQELPIELKLFINTTSLQKDFNLNAKYYQPYFDVFIKEFKNDWSYTQNQAREIMSFTDSFINLMFWCDETFGHLNYPTEFIKYFCVHQVAMHPDLIKLIEDKRNSNEFTDEEKEYLRTNGFYKIKRNNSFRKYDNLVNMPKVIRQKVFKGFHQLDLDACFSSVAYNELDMKNSGLQFADLLCGSKKYEFRQQIMKDFNCSYNDAKKTSQYLFSAKYTHSWGVQWFDNLHKEISKRVIAILNNKEKNIVDFHGKTKKLDCFHAFFSYFEQQIIEAIKTNSFFQIHDAILLEPNDKLILTKTINSNSIIYNDNTYYFTITEI